jgi:hypothetical protein
MGSTSEPQAGQWKVRSGRSRISGWPHSQACLPRASGKAVMRQRVSSNAPLKRPPHNSQRIESRSEGWSLLASHRGQTRESGLDAIDEPLILCPFLAMGCSENYAPRSSASGFLQTRPNRPD